MGERTDIKEKTDKGKKKRTKGEKSNREQANLVFSTTKEYVNINEEVCGDQEKGGPAPVDKPTDVASIEPSWNGKLNDNEVDAKTSPEDGIQETCKSSLNEVSQRHENGGAAPKIETIDSKRVVVDKNSSNKDQNIQLGREEHASKRNESNGLMAARSPDQSEV